MVNWSTGNNCLRNTLVGYLILYGGVYREWGKKTLAAGI